MDAVEDRLGQPVEPAEIDRQIEIRDTQIIAIAVEQRGFLGAGEQPVRHFQGLTRRDQQKHH